MFMFIPRFVFLPKHVLAFLLLLNLSFLSACSNQTPKPLTFVVSEASGAVFALANERQSLASGFFVAPDLLLTNRHVHADGALFLLHSNGDKTLLKRLAVDKKHDIALYQSVGFRVQQPLLLALNLPSVATSVVALGNPFGAGIAASAGIVSALPHAGQSQPLLQTDAAVNAGNSGGPLLNQQGQVVGMVSRRGAVGSGIGFAVPNKVLSAFLQRVIEPAKYPDLPAATSP